MGCKQSKTTAVTGPGVTQVKPASAGKKGKVRPLDVSSPTKTTINVNDKKEDIFQTSNNTKRNSLGSTGSLLDEAQLTNTGDRGGSAGSKVSKHSTDSGLGENEDFVITENSDPNLVQEIENNFTENDELDLCIAGKACPRMLSGKDKERMEEQRILAALQEEGLIQKSKTQSAGGVSFEITQQEKPRRLPAFLGKLEKRKKKKKRPLTEDEIKEKLEIAEQRRKEKEREKLEKINQLDRKTTENLTDFADRLKQKDEEQQKKIDKVVDKREQHLMEVREKLRAKAEYAKQVRLRKQLALSEGGPIPDDGGEKEVVPTC